MSRSKNKGASWDEIRPTPAGATLAERIRAVGCKDKDPVTGRALGASSMDELAAWCADLAEIASSYQNGRTIDVALTIDGTEAKAVIDKYSDEVEERIAGIVDASAARIAELARERDENMASRVAAEAMLVDLLAVELEVVRSFRRAGVVAEDATPSTAELLAMLKRGNGTA